jgi:hypothetical protein
MISRDDLEKARPNVDTATIRFVRGEISEAEYQRQVEQERRDEVRPVKEHTRRADAAPEGR